MREENKPVVVVVVAKLELGPHELQNSCILIRPLRSNVQSDCDSVEKKKTPLTTQRGLVTLHMHPNKSWEIQELVSR